MRTHLGCVGRVSLGQLDEETRERLQQLQAAWLEFSRDPPSLVARHVQHSDAPILPNVVGELLEFLGMLSEAERAEIVGGAFYCLDEETGQYVRLKVSPGAFLTVAWAQPDYSRGRWMPYRGERVPMVFEAHQRLNGVVTFCGKPTAADELKAVAKRHAGTYPEGEFAAHAAEGRVEIRLRNVNSTVLPLLAALCAAADPPSSLEGELDVSSFRSGDLEDYCRFVLKSGETWLVRPSLWAEAPQEDVASTRSLESAA